MESVRYLHHMLDDKMHAYLFDILETLMFVQFDCILDSVVFSETINIFKIQNV